jgi:hypothetical protein
MATPGDEPGSTGAGPAEIFDVGAPPDEPVSSCRVELPESCQEEWTGDEFLATGDEASIDAIDDGLHVFVGAVPPQADEVWTLEFDVPCPRILGAPKLDQTQFEVPATVGISVAGKFEYSLVGRYPALVDVEYVDGCAQLLVHEISVDPEPLEPAGAPLFAWDDLLRTGYVAD